MRASVKAALAAAAAGLLAAPQLLAAQLSVGLGVEATGIYATLSGDDFEGTDAGFGLDAQARKYMGMLSIGAGLQYTSHNVDAFDASVSILGIYAEPRLHFKLPASPVQPFAGARLAYLRRSATVSGTDLSGSGFLYGVTGGITLSAAPKINVVVAVLLSGVSFGNVKADGEEIADTDAGGSSLAIRAGISIKL